MGDTKSNDKKMTLLHYFVRLVETSFPEISGWYAEIPAVEDARRGIIIPVRYILVLMIQIVGLVGMQQDLRELREGLANVEQEIELTPDSPPNDIFKTHIKV